MKKIFKPSVIVIVALACLVSAGTLWAGPVAPCSPKAKACVEKDGEIFCTWSEESVSNRLVPGRGGQLAYVRLPVTTVRTEKCSDAGHSHK